MLRHPNTLRRIQQTVATHSSFFSTFTPQPSEAIQHSLNTPNLFAAFTALANEHQAINLGQGFPTFGTPQFVIDNVAKAVNNQPFNQYIRSVNQQVRHSVNQPASQSVSNQSICP